MKRYTKHVRIATIVGLVSIAALALSVAPAGAGQTHHKKATVITLPATGITATQAKLNGKIFAFGGFTKYRFEYGTTPSLGQKTRWVSLDVCPPGNMATNWESPPGTGTGTYCECPPGTTNGAYCECPPGTTNGAYCECPPGTTNPTYCVNETWIPVWALIKGLSPHTKYYFLLVAVGRHGQKTYGAEQSFRTKFFIPVRRHHHH